MNGRKSRRGTYLQQDQKGRTWVDYKNVDELRRLMTPNGKIYSRKRLGTTSNDQRKVAKAEFRRKQNMELLDKHKTQETDVLRMKHGVTGGSDNTFTSFGN